MSAPGPVLIGGLSHSGKTELRLVLEALPDIAFTRKTYLWDRFDGRTGNLERDADLDRFLSVITTDELTQRLDPDPMSLRREFLSGPRTASRLFGLIHAQHATRLGKTTWGEQLGFVERFAPSIFEAFPDARLVHMIRDPRALLAERTARRRRGSVGWETARWMRSAELAAGNLARFADGYRVVRYEVLAADPVTTVREVCAFLGEPFHPEVEAAAASLDFGACRVERPAASDVAFVERYAQRALPAFGYERARVVLTPRERVSYACVDRPVNRLAMAASRAIGSRRVAGRIGG